MRGKKDIYYDCGIDEENVDLNGNGLTDTSILLKS